MFRLGVARVAESAWTIKCKKPSDEPEGSPAKALCTAYEKSLKKMEGDLTFMKDQQWVDHDILSHSHSEAVYIDVQFIEFVKLRFSSSTLLGLTQFGITVD